MWRCLTSDKCDKVCVFTLQHILLQDWRGNKPFLLLLLFFFLKRSSYHLHRGAMPWCFHREAGQFGRQEMERITLLLRGCRASPPRSSHTQQTLITQSVCHPHVVVFFFFFFFFFLTPTLRLPITPLRVQAACVVDLRRGRGGRRSTRSFLALICMMCVRRGAKGWISRTCHLIWRKSVWRIFIWFMVTFCGRDGAHRAGLQKNPAANGAFQRRRRRRRGVIAGGGGSWRDRVNPPRGASKRKANRGEICRVQCRCCCCTELHTHTHTHTHTANTLRRLTTLRGRTDGREGSRASSHPSTSPPPSTHPSKKSKRETNPSNNETWAVPTVWAGDFDGRFLTFYQMQAAIFAAAPRMSTTQCSNSYFFPLEVNKKKKKEKRKKKGRKKESRGIKGPQRQTRGGEMIN